MILNLLLKNAVFASNLKKLAAVFERFKISSLVLKAGVPDTFCPNLSPGTRLYINQAKNMLMK